MAFRILKLSIIIVVLLIVTFNSFFAIFTHAITNQTDKTILLKNSTHHEYRFSDIGIFTNSLDWNGVGTFELSINKTFDLNNIGPALLIIEFTSDGDRPESPGYTFIGEFNLQPFESILSRSIISTDDSEEIRQFAIPLNAEGRIYSNNLVLNISCTNEYSSGDSGTLTIKDTSRLLIGDFHLLNNYGNYQVQVYPEKQSGTSSLSGLKLRSFIPLTIKNETLFEKSECNLDITLQFIGEISVSLTFFDANERAYPFEKNQTSENTLNAKTQFSPEFGSNFYSIELVIYSDNLWGSDFNVTLTDCNLELAESQKGFGFGFSDLEIPFFQWPAIPIVGIIILFLWIMPYSVLKYREWKKLPGEVDINILDDEDINILDPEGLTAGDDDDDIEEAFDFEDD
ncbi:MAG: hypothetical protein FK732_02620 [Asgard group archaeon]|nr:hypothetical protein [Asgard group archaeon]